MTAPLRVLVVEDSQDDALLMLRELQSSGYTPTYKRVDTAPAMKAALENHTWDLVIADYSMPRFSAPTALTMLQESHLDLPFIIVSGAIGEATAVSAMKAGAHDYVFKGNLSRLGPAVERELRQAEERRERRRAEEQERRLHQELEEQHQQAEKNVRELTALNKLFQEHILQRFEVVQAYGEVLDELEKLSQDMKTLVERARTHMFPDPPDSPAVDGNDSNAGAVYARATRIIRRRLREKAPN